MTTFKLFAAAAVLSVSITCSVSAQPMIDEPGMFAFVHPDGDLGIASARPADALAAYRADTDRVVTTARHRARHSHSARVN